MTVLRNRHNDAGFHVLVADDVDANRVLAQSMLHRLGAQVTLARDGGEALDLMISTNFDTVLMDWHMPRLDGLEAARLYFLHCEQNNTTPVPVILMTADVTDRAQALSREAGLTGFLPKPIGMESLRAALEPWWLQSTGQGSIQNSGPTNGANQANDDDEPLLLDHGTLHQLADDLGGMGVLRGVIDAFLNEVDDRRSTVRNVETNGVSAAHRACHTLKSTASSLGAWRLAAHAADFEIRFNAGELPNLVERQTFDQLVIATVEAITTFRAEVSGGPS